ncbi:snRNA-activating protein complex subunit 2 [Oryctolagus cuniculus]|uniref:Small nuclear RNA activating complex polypeptide 2 n=1 Tax=Oryctolagus cuniculus TaxID=9986 RepID=G1TL34_RABIT|nr:snRNA-activating protein complex subunit 2 [Oryctolagus cuniculus]
MQGSRPLCRELPMHEQEGGSSPQFPEEQTELPSVKGPCSFPLQLRSQPPCHKGSGGSPRPLKAGPRPHLLPPSRGAFLTSAATVAPPPPRAAALHAQTSSLTGMKPPARRRATPARYVEEVTGPQAWSPREKRQLLQLLQARHGQPEPDAAELAQELQSRSETEIRNFLQKLKARVVREAIQRVHPDGPQGARRREAQPPAPIEVWMDLAERVTGPLEGALTTAFSQALTIATTEPTNLLHSRPAKPTQARAKPLLLSAPGGPQDPAPEVPGPAPETSGPAPEAPSKSSSGPSLAEGDFPVDFEKIYKYLASFSRGGQAPELSATESAVVLDLLLSLPEELSRLPCVALAEHMAQMYNRLTAPEPSLAEGGPAGESPPGESPAEAGGEAGRGQASSQGPEGTGPSDLRSTWQAAGICPLNPFVVPLELLGRVASPAR